MEWQLAITKTIGNGQQKRLNNDNGRPVWTLLGWWGAADLPSPPGNWTIMTIAMTNGHWPWRVVWHKLRRILEGATLQVERPFNPEIHRIWSRLSESLKKMKRKWKRKPRIGCVTFFVRPQMDIGIRILIIWGKEKRKHTFSKDGCFTFLVTTVGYWEAQVKLSMVVTPTWVPEINLRQIW